MQKQRDWISRVRLISEIHPPRPCHSEQLAGSWPTRSSACPRQRSSTSPAREFGWLVPRPIRKSTPRPLTTDQTSYRKRLTALQKHALSARRRWFEVNSEQSRNPPRRWVGRQSRRGIDRQADVRGDQRNGGQDLPLRRRGRFSTVAGRPRIAGRWPKSPLIEANPTRQHEAWRGPKLPS